MSTTEFMGANLVILFDKRVRYAKKVKNHCRSRQFFGGWKERMLCPNFPEKLSDGKRFPYKFSVAVDTSYFPLQCCHRLENIIFGSWNPYNTTEKKSTLGCAKPLSETSWLSTLEYLPHSSEVWGSIHIPAVGVTKEPHTQLK